MSGMFSRWKINENPRVCGEIKSHTPLPTASVRSVITVEISGKSIYIKKKNVVTDRGRRFEKSKANKEKQNERTSSGRWNIRRVRNASERSPQPCSRVYRTTGRVDIIQRAVVTTRSKRRKEKKRREKKKKRIITTLFAVPQS